MSQQTTQLNPVKIKHFANIGDIIAMLAGLKKFSEKTKRKIVLCQQLNVEADYYAGATHPTKHDNGSEKLVMCNQKMFDMIRPLVLAQTYVEDMVVFNGQPINFDIDVIRKQIFVNIPHQAIQQWPFLAYPDMAADLSKPWIEPNEVDISKCSLSNPQIITQTTPIEDLKDKIILNFTERYRNSHLHYFWLKKYQERLIFAGTQTEYQLFIKQWELPFVPYLNVNNFLELAYILKKAKFLLSNQSFCWNVSFAMKTPHILELCEGAPNCQAFFYEKSFAYYHQSAIPYYFKELLK